MVALPSAESISGFTLDAGNFKEQNTTTEYFSSNPYRTDSPAPSHDEQEDYYQEDYDQEDYDQEDYDQEDYDQEDYDQENYEPVEDMKTR